MSKALLTAFAAVAILVGFEKLPSMLAQAVNAPLAAATQKIVGTQLVAENNSQSDWEKRFWRPRD